MDEVTAIAGNRLEITIYSIWCGGVKTEPKPITMEDSMREIPVRLFPNRNPNPRRGNPMTKLDLSQFKPIPGFDSLKWKQEVQAKIYEETKEMTR